MRLFLKVFFAVLAALFVFFLTIKWYEDWDASLREQVRMKKLGEYADRLKKLQRDK